MEYLSGKKDIVFVGLNPVKEAKKAKAVFCIRSTFWEILTKAKIIEGYNADLKKCADEIFNEKKDTKYDLGYADLVPECDKKKSSDVKILDHHVPDLLLKISETNAKKIVLLSKKVATAFAEKLKIENKCPDYGFLAECKYSTHGKKFKVYVMPFPETVPIKDKHKYYKEILAK